MEGVFRNKKKTFLIELKSVLRSYFYCSGSLIKMSHPNGLPSENFFGDIVFEGGTGGEGCDVLAMVATENVI